jgi:CRISPR-associated protein Csh1
VKSQLARNQGCFVTFGFLEDQNLKYLGDYPEFQKLLVESVKCDYRKIARNNHVCSICGLFKSEVFGGAIPIPFYTLDKPGYIAGGFREEDAWKNAPVCLECSLKIEEGKKFLDEYLQFRMGGVRYYLLPKFIFGQEEAKDSIFSFFQVATQREVLAGKALKRFSEDEQEILEFLSGLEDVLTFNFLFYETPTKSVFRITLLVENILPSRISALFNAKIRAESNNIFKNVKMGKQYENIEFRFSNLTRRPSKDIPSLIPTRKEFLEIVDKTFRGVSLDRDLLFSWFMTTIRGIFANEGYLKPWVFWAFISLLFFGELGTLSMSGSEKLQEGGVSMVELGAKAEEFFGSYRETFSSPARKALFLLGVLAQKLLNIQFQERSATPFRKNLKGLRMKEDDFRGLLPKIQNKLEEYGKNYYRRLEELISDYLVQSGQSWGMSIDEMNFYFVLGMNLEDKVSQALGLAKDKEKEEENDEQCN